MTCIVGLEHQGKVYVGGDSASVSGLDITTYAPGKVFRNGPLVIGYTSSFRMGQVLQYNLKPPAHARGVGDMRYLVTALVPALRQCLADAGYTEKHNGRESGGTFLLGYRGRLYSIHDDFQVNRNADGRNAIGCGYAYALGSLHATRAMRKPVDRIREALLAATRYSAGVAAPYKVVSQ